MKWFKSYTNFVVDEDTNNDNSGNQTNSGDQPAEWRPYNPQEFSKGAEEIAKLYKSDPTRTSDAEGGSSSDDTSDDS